MLKRLPFGPWEPDKAATTSLRDARNVMPGTDGYELIRQVRALPSDRGAKVPAIALTAYTRIEDRLQALRAGYDMHVPKPVELTELCAVATSLTRRTN